MKKYWMLILFCFCWLLPTFAQYSQLPPQPPKPIKDDGVGKAINFGLTFAPTYNWMYPKTEGYERCGVGMGMRYGINLNVNLTPKKNFYVSTGVFCENLTGKMIFNDLVLIPVDSSTFNGTETRRTYKAMYLTIPLGITMKTNSISNFFVCGNVGLYNSFLLRAYNQDTYNFSGEYWTREKRESSEAASMRESAFAGMGFEYSITKDFRAGFMLNYVYSFSNYFKGNHKAPNNLSGLDQKAHFGYLEMVFHINFL